MSSGDGVVVATSQLPMGVTLLQAVKAADGKILLTAGSKITKSVRDGLIALGVSDVTLTREDAEAIGLLGRPAGGGVSPLSGIAARVSAVTARLDELAAVVPLQLTNTGPAFKEQVRVRGCDPYDTKQRDRVTAKVGQISALLDQMVEQARQGVAQDLESLNDAASEFMIELADDPDNVISSSAEAAPQPQVMQRAVRMALLGMAVAIEMDFDEPIVRELGLCALLHDWGIAELPSRLQDPLRELTRDDQAELAQHPLLTVSILEQMEDLTDAVRIAASQVHENPDGTGYPRGLTSSEIHPFAHILHVVDAFVTLTAEMRGRGAYRPYDAMVYLLHQAKSGHVDTSAMRALLNVVSLFPIGSRVRLSDGGEAQVLRRNGSNYMQPIVQRVGAMRQFRPDAPHAPIIDLVASETRLIAPVASPDRKEQPLENNAMDQILWDTPLPPP